MRNTIYYLRPTKSKCERGVAAMAAGSTCANILAQLVDEKVPPIVDVPLGLHLVLDSGAQLILVRLLHLAFLRPARDYARS